MDSERDGDSRLKDYDNGVKAMEDNDFQAAIDYFQTCMKKLSNQGLGLSSELFPKCLQNLSKCYSSIDDMENALSFKKFEKLYYETVLLHNGLGGLELKETGSDSDEVDTPRDQGDGSSKTSIVDSTQVPESSNDIEIVKRASEYEQLAKLCLKQECVSLALEYSGKATLLYRYHFGDDHEQTKNSFKLFTSVYAEAGKQQYLETMAKVDLEADLTVSSPSDVEETILRHRRGINMETAEANDTVTSSNKKRPMKRTRSILKKGPSYKDVLDHSSGEPSPTETRHVTFADPLPRMDRFRYDDDGGNSATNLILFILICILIVLVSLAISTIVCQMKPDMNACAEFRREMTYYYNKFRRLHRAYYT